MTLFATSPNPFPLHRLALSPLVSEDPLRALETVKETVRESEEQKFLDFLLQNGLGPLWHNTLKKNGVSSFFSPGFTDDLKQSRLLTTVQYLKQQHSLKKIENIFRKNSLPHAVFKGAHIREIIYNDPAVRPACDIDILVSKRYKARAINALVAEELTFHPVAKNISHEASLNDGNASIDLHWDILRPGRTRIDLTDAFLKARKQFSDHWGFNNEAALFIMLVHPIFTKYGTAPQASLVRMVDLVRWVQTQQIDWDKTHNWLKQGGVQTAAWITGKWLKMLTGISLPESFMHSIKPGRARTLYLRQWLDRNPSSRLIDYPTFIQAGFTLPAHDTFTDALHAVISQIREKRMAEENLNKLISSTNL